MKMTPEFEFCHRRAPSKCKIFQSPRFYHSIKKNASTMKNAILFVQDSFKTDLIEIFNKSIPVD